MGRRLLYTSLLPRRGPRNSAPQAAGACPGGYMTEQVRVVVTPRTVRMLFRSVAARSSGVSASRSTMKSNGPKTS